MVHFHEWLRRMIEPHVCKRTTPDSPPPPSPDVGRAQPSDSRDAPLLPHLWGMLAGFRPPAG
jgi:hypothetical protein